MLFLGRVVSGMGIGYGNISILVLCQYCVLVHRVLLQISPLYIAEIAPKEKRGAMVAFVNTFSSTGALVHVYILSWQMFLCINTFSQTGTLVNFATKNVAFGWRITLSLHFLSGAMLGLCALLLPETPR